jgi:pimeloyl-ACP methyl ester carboxylesterase
VSRMTHMRTGPFAPPVAAQELTVDSADGSRLHVEVHGPENAPAVVLSHGWTCSTAFWAAQIRALATGHRVIAYDQRGHGRSPAATQLPYTADMLADDLEAVLDATLAPGERAVIAGHSMGGIAITSWAERYPERVAQRVDAVALINTTTGDLLRHVQFLPVPPQLADARVRAAGTLLRTFGAAPLLRAVDRPSRRFVSTIAVGRDADPAVTEFIYELFTSTPAAGRGGWARTLVDGLGAEHIGLTNLTVPTLVIGCTKDRLLPMVSSRHIARMAPNLASFVELSGGHCAIVERPDEVNKHLRMLIESVTEDQRATS